MDLRDRKQLKGAASDSIAKAASDPRKLVILHTAAVLILSLAAWAIDLLLENQIGNTGGLGGVGLRAVLETVRKALRLAQVIALPFWQVGWVYAALKIARGEPVGKKDLLEGFRRFLPYLRLTVLRGLILFGAVLAASYVSSFVVMMTPLADPIVNLVSSDLTGITEAEFLAQMEKIAVPMTVITAVLSLLLYAPFFYRFRMAEFVLLDSPQPGARKALRGSRVLMRDRTWDIIRLDLSFWWFWLLTGLVAVLGWIDVILPAAGIALPWAEEISYFAAFLLTAAAQLVLYYFCKAKVDVTYAQAYQALLDENE